MDSEIAIRVAGVQKLFLDPKSFPCESMSQLAQRVLLAFRSGRVVAFVGNGGSAAEAMHLAAEFTGKCVVPHAPMAALCLNESQSALTSIANDFGVDQMFSRQVEAHLGKDDILIALSTSGRSPNILRALSKAVQLGVECYLWTGNSDIEIDNVTVWKVPSSSTPRIQEIHLAWGHILAEVIELQL
jgi:D-sedoheptulose 7-phosphate isomerase